MVYYYIQQNSTSENELGQNSVEGQSQISISAPFNDLMILNYIYMIVVIIHTIIVNLIQRVRCHINLSV